MVAVDVVRRYMQRFHYSLYDGSIYKKVPHAKYTSVFCCSISDFMHHILGNPEVADAVAHHIGQIISLLKVKSCRLIQPIKIDYNYIEVLPRGTCFDIAGKRFIQDPGDLKGKCYFLAYYR